MCELYTECLKNYILRITKKSTKLYKICLLDLHDKYLPPLRSNACGSRKLYFCTHHTCIRLTQ